MSYNRRSPSASTAVKERLYFSASLLAKRGVLRQLQLAWNRKIPAYEVLLWSKLLEEDPRLASRWFSSEEFGEFSFLWNGIVYVTVFLNRYGDGHCGFSCGKCQGRLRYIGDERVPRCGHCQPIFPILQSSVAVVPLPANDNLLHTLESFLRMVLPPMSSVLQTELEVMGLSRHLLGLSSRWEALERESH